MSCFSLGKCVHFNKTVKIFYYRQRQHESNVCWQEVARDRVRFTRHIRDIEHKIEWVLTEPHRESVYSKLYIET